MKRIEVKLSLEVVAPLLDVIKAVADSLNTRLAVEATSVESDNEMTEMWRDSLLVTQNDGINAFLALFDSEFFKTGIVSFDTDNAELILRACAAIRLQMRTQLLSRITDEMLEQGVENLEVLPAPTRRAMMCYMFLATIQDLIIQHLDASILNGGNE